MTRSELLKESLTAYLLLKQLRDTAVLEGDTESVHIIGRGQLNLGAMIEIIQSDRPIPSQDEFEIILSDLKEWSIATMLHGR